MPLTELTLLELAEKLAAGEGRPWRPRGRAWPALPRWTERSDAFLRLDEHGALAAAEASDARRKAGNPLGPWTACRWPSRTSSSPRAWRRRAPRVSPGLHSPV
jgi:Asp-tRNA(Asn)/Glu-tRNA(Gln) amidotransferase A subunit family amidase